MSNRNNEIGLNTISISGTTIHRNNVSSITINKQPESNNNYCVDNYRVYIRVINPIISNALYIEFFCETYNECYEYLEWFDRTPTITVRQPNIPGKC